ncbi:MAG: SDR family NAD(P)-dependent oxidoreductase, partial [Parvibaculum sp.]
MTAIASKGTALVTGAAHRIGRAIALALADDGWTIAVHHRSSAADAAEVVREIEATGGRAAAFAADLALMAETRGLVAA